MRGPAAVGRGARRIGRARRSAVEPLTWTVLAQSVLGLVILALPGDGARAAATVVFLLVPPALAVFLALRTPDLLARTVLAAATALVVNAVVAEVMLATGTWSLTGGVVAVALIAPALAVAGSARRRPRGQRPGPAGVRAV